DRNLPALLHAGVVTHGDSAHAALRRRPVFHQPSDRRKEVAEGIFGIDAGFHRPAREGDVLLPELELFACGNPYHLLDEIDAGDELGHGMFDLQTGVHLQEVKALVLSRDKLDGARGIVFHGPGERDRLLAHLAPRRLVQKRRRRLLDHLLIAALDRTFALAEIDDIAVLVAEHLDLDVAGIDDELFYKDAIVAKRGLRLRPGELKPFG